MVLIEGHLGDLRRENILHNTDRLSSPRIPHLDILLASNENLQSLL